MEPRDYMRITCATELRASLTWLRQDRYDLNIQIRVEIRPSWTKWIDMLNNQVSVEI